MSSSLSTDWGDDNDNDNGDESMAVPQELDGDDWGDMDDINDENEGKARDGTDNDPSHDHNKHSSSSSSDYSLLDMTSSPSLSRQQSFLVLDESSLREKLNSLVDSTAEVLDVSPSESLILLRHYGWKGKKLQVEWFENQGKVRETVGITDLDNAKNKIPPLLPNGLIQCSSAYCDEVPLSSAFALRCGHWFCHDCWSAYLTSKLRDGSSSLVTTCMGMKCQLDHPHKFGCNCKEMVSEELFVKFVTDQTLITKYKRWLLDSFVEGQRVIKWCPRPGCTHAVSYVSGGTRAVVCKCGWNFCFSCSEPSHTPAPCDLVSKWLSREKSDDATQIWLAARTKECPNSSCRVRIEKNKACNHMTCAKCSYSFCWLCKGPWSAHGSQTGGYYVCSKYETEMKEGKISSEESTIQQNQKVLQKYSYYYKRFKCSADAIKFTVALREKLEKQINDQDFHKFAYVGETIDKLILARTVLQWTYSLSYYLKSGKDKHLFEYQQDLLNEATESLQDIIDNHDATYLLTHRKDIINKTSAMDKFRQEMVAQVERGDFEDLLLSTAESGGEEGNVWTCTNCKFDNKKKDQHCNKSA